MIWNGGPAFYLPDTLGARYLDFLLHRPDLGISCFELEVAIQPEKGQVRSRNSIQPESDARARREYRRALEELEAQRQAALAAGERAREEQLRAELKTVQAALKGGGGPADTGERARDNVRKRIAVVRRHLRKAGQTARAFEEHLSRYLSLGYECFYTHPNGATWD